MSKVNKSNYSSVTGSGTPKDKTTDQRPSGQDLDGVTKQDRAALGSVCNSVPSENCRFKRGLTEKEVKIRLFILETLHGYKELGYIEKLSFIIQRSDYELQEYLYDFIENEEILRNYTCLKDKLIEYCIVL